MRVSERERERERAPVYGSFDRGTSECIKQEPNEDQFECDVLHSMMMLDRQLGEARSVAPGENGASDVETGEKPRTCKEPTKPFAPCPEPPH